ncbi:MAG: hypothetical protein ACYDHC_02520 [Desulfuromonadaceae bacterium]
MRTRLKRIKREYASTGFAAAKEAGERPRSLLTCLCLVVFAASPAAAEQRITFYRDGALFSQEAVAVKGVINMQLPAGILEHTLTVVPGRGTTIQDIEAHRSDAGKPLDMELEALTEQRRRLEDRLRALETRETIFTAAAKAQSGKAPRKTKANPDPLLGIRQGTDFAIAQLEAVYTARRRATQEMQRIDVRLGAAEKKRRQTEESLRITVTPPRGSVTLRYATAQQGWQPRYNLHTAGDGSARLQLAARITADTRGRQVKVSPGTLAESATAETFPVQPGGAPLASYHLPLTKEQYSEGLYNNFSGTLTNSTSHYLQPGESGLFRRGTYMGRFTFEGMSSGRSSVISYGKQ